MTEREEESRDSGLDRRAEELDLRHVAHPGPGDQRGIDELCEAHPEVAEMLRAIERAVMVVRRLGGSPFELGLSARLERAYGAGVDPGVALDREPEADSGPPSKLFRKLHAQGARGGRYRLLGEVARGGMGAILRVWDDELRRTIAIKVVLGKGAKDTGETPPVDPRTLGRFLEEAQVTGQLDHPGMPVHELGLDAEGRVYASGRHDLRGVAPMDDRDSQARLRTISTPLPARLKMTS